MNAFKVIAIFIGLNTLVVGQSQFKTLKMGTRMGAGLLTNTPTQYDVEYLPCNRASLSKTSDAR